MLLFRNNKRSHTLKHSCTSVAVDQRDSFAIYCHYFSLFSENQYFFMKNKKIEQSANMKVLEEEADQNTLISDRLRSIEHKSKKHGINVNELFKDKVLSNKNCFWSLLQSQTDRMHHYYYHEENHIIDSLTRADDASILSIALLRDLKSRAIWLQDFVKYNIHMFEMSVSKFDVKHHVNTFDEEMNYFEETYSFTKGERLTQVLDAIDAFAFDILRPRNEKTLERKFSRRFGKNGRRSSSEREKSKGAIRNLSESIHERKKVQKIHLSSNIMIQFLLKIGVRISKKK